MYVHYYMCKLCGEIFNNLVLLLITIVQKTVRLGCFEQQESAMFKKYATFVKYFESKEPRYDLAFWNVHNRCVEGLPRTMNNVEGWHNAFYATIPIKDPHLNIYYTFFYFCLKHFCLFFRILELK